MPDTDRPCRGCPHTEQDHDSVSGKCYACNCNGYKPPAGSIRISVRELSYQKGIHLRQKAYTKWVERAKHFFVKYKGYGIDLDGLKWMNRKGVKTIIIREQDTGTIWTSHIQAWASSFAFRYQQGHEKGPQIILPIELMSEVK